MQTRILLVVSWAIVITLMGFSVQANDERRPIVEIESSSINEWGDLEVEFRINDQEHSGTISWEAKYKSAGFDSTHKGQTSWKKGDVSALGTASFPMNSKLTRVRIVRVQTY